MHDLYSQALLAQYKARAGRCLKWIFALVGAGMAVCIFLCTLVRTGNAGKLLFCVTALSAVIGWASMCLLYFVYAPSRMQAEHIAGMLACEPEECEGEIYVHTEKIHIPRSIDICRVTLASGDESTSFHVNAALVQALPENGKRVRVRFVRKFIVAYEVIT